MKRLKELYRITKQLKKYVIGKVYYEVFENDNDCNNFEFTEEYMNRFNLTEEEQKFIISTS